MILRIFFLFYCAIVLCALNVYANNHKAYAKTKEEIFSHLVKTRVLTLTYGQKKAPITLRAFTSLSCVHCKEFHTKYMSKLIKKYRGKVRLVIEPFVMDGYALRASLALYAIPPGPQRIAGFNQLFKYQDQWIDIVDTEALHQKFASYLGLAVVQVEASISNDTLGKSIIFRRVYWENKYQIDGAPVFILESKGTQPRKIDGLVSYDDFCKEIEKMLSFLKEGIKQ